MIEWWLIERTKGQQYLPALLYHVRWFDSVPFSLFSQILHPYYYAIQIFPIRQRKRIQIDLLEFSDDVVFHSENGKSIENCMIQLLLELEFIYVW